MTRRKSTWLNSVIVSAMVSESRTFTVAEFPDWTRLFWLVWLSVPCLFAGPGRLRHSLAAGIVTTVQTLRADWLAGCQFILGLTIPVWVATG